MKKERRKSEYGPFFAFAPKPGAPNFNVELQFNNIIDYIRTKKRNKQPNGDTYAGCCPKAVGALLVAVVIVGGGDPNGG